MNLRCLNCQTEFTLDESERSAALRKMQSEDRWHYEATCPHCRQANPISRERLEIFTPGWKKAIKASGREPKPSREPRVRSPRVPAAAARRQKRTEVSLLIGGLLFGLLCMVVAQFVPSEGMRYEEPDPVWPLSESIVCPDGELRFTVLPYTDRRGNTRYSMGSHHAWCEAPGSGEQVDVIDRVRIVTGVMEGAALYAFGWPVLALVYWLNDRSEKRRGKG